MPTLIAAELLILAVEATLAALTSFAPLGPLGLRCITARPARGVGFGAALTRLGAAKV